MEVCEFPVVKNNKFSMEYKIINGKLQETDKLKFFSNKGIDRELTTTSDSYDYN